MTSIKKTRTRLAPAISGLLFLAACGVPIVSGSRFAADVDAATSLTFAWNQDRDMVVGDPRLQNNQFFEDRLHEAVEWELSLRGFRRTDDNPDLLIHHHLTLADHEMVEEIIDQEGYSREEVYSVEEGTVAIHLVDARTGETFWVAWGQANIESALWGPEQMRAWVYEVVEQIFNDWPIPARTES